MLTCSGAKLEVYAQGFTLNSSQSRGKWQVSTAGGDNLRWRGDGKELCYRFGSTFFAMDVKRCVLRSWFTQPLFEAATARTNSALGDGPFLVTRDGQRFLVFAPIEGESNPPLEVLVNWQLACELSLVELHS